MTFLRIFFGSAITGFCCCYNIHFADQRLKPETVLHHIVDKSASANFEKQNANMVADKLVAKKKQRRQNQSARMGSK